MARSVPIAAEIALANTSLPLYPWLGQPPRGARLETMHTYLERIGASNLELTLSEAQQADINGRNDYADKALIAATFGSMRQGTNLPLENTNSTFYDLGAEVFGMLNSENSAYAILATQSKLPQGIPTVYDIDKMPPGVVHRLVTLNKDQYPLGLPLVTATHNLFRRYEAPSAASLVQTLGALGIKGISLPLSFPRMDAVGSETITPEEIWTQTCESGEVYQIEVNGADQETRSSNPALARQLHRELHDFMRVKSWTSALQIPMGWLLRKAFEHWVPPHPLVERASLNPTGRAVLRVVIRTPPSLRPDQPSRHKRLVSHIAEIAEDIGAKAVTREPFHW